MDKPITKAQESSDDLLENLRQISDALWDAAQRRDLIAINALLTKRDSLFEEANISQPLPGQLRQDLSAIRAADKYIMRQLESELEWLDRRLQGVARRRKAGANYRAGTRPKNYVTRTG